MRVILLERVGRHGGIGDEATVKDGYARNFLLPEGKALRATEANRKKFEAERAVIEKRNEERRNEAAGIADGLNGHTVIMIRQAGENGQLYGSVSTRDISDSLKTDGYTVPRAQIDLTNPDQDRRVAHRAPQPSSGGRGFGSDQCRPFRRRGTAPGQGRGHDRRQL